MKNYLEKFWFRMGLVLIVALFVVELGSLDPMATRLRTLDFYKEYGATVLMSTIIFELVFKINSVLNSRLPWHGQVFSRLMLQMMLGWIAPLFMVFGMASLYFFAYGVDIFRTDYLYYGFPFIILLILILNIVVVMTPYALIGLQHVKSAEQTSNAGTSEVVNEPEEERRYSLSRIKVLDGNGVLMLDPGEIAASYIVNGRVIVKNSEEKEYLTDLTLDELENEYLPKDTFFRINRQLIASNAVCRAYDPLKYGKLEVKLDVNVPVNAVVSQLKAKGFRDWMEN